MAVIKCPDCGTAIELPPDVRSGDLVECLNCAGHALRIHEEHGRRSATLAHRVSCPDCEEILPLPEGAKPGDIVACRGGTYRLTLEYGAFAAEKA